MEALTGVTGQSQNQGIVNSIENQSNSIDTDSQNSVEHSSTASTDFAAFMKDALGANKPEVNEEELFSALIEENLQSESPEAAAFFKSEKEKLTASMSRADGYVPVEEVALQALKNTVTAGKIDRAKAELINGKAFAGAQLDSNHEALYDGRGSAEDPTIAVAKMEQALLSMKAMMDKFESGETQAESRSLDLGATPYGGAPSSGSLPDASSTTPRDPSVAPSGPQDAADGSEGFLWKPVSESNGNLVVLLPSSLTGLVDRVALYSNLPPTEESKIEEGKFSSIANGERGHYRFSKPGEQYEDGVYVVAFRNDGETVTYKIDETGKRVD